MSSLGHTYFETIYCQIVSNENRSSIFFVTIYFHCFNSARLYGHWHKEKVHLFILRFSFPKTVPELQVAAVKQFFMFSFRAPPKLEPAHALSSSLLVEFVSQKQEQRMR